MELYTGKENVTNRVWKSIQAISLQAHIDRSEVIFKNVHADKFCNQENRYSIKYNNNNSNNSVGVY
jgi:hypothetical protein